MRLVIEIETDNAAFDEQPTAEIARILDDLSARIRDGETFEVLTKLRDINGNPTGHIKAFESL